jgi:hypothetical protein
MNSHVVSTMISVSGIGGDAGHQFVPTIQIPMFSTPGVVDVSGMEFAIALIMEGGSTFTQTIASGASTVVLNFGDAGTAAAGAASGNHLLSNDTFSNSVTGAWTIHGANMAVGTSTTDLDADDWVNLHVVANTSAVAGVGALTMKAAFVYGKPGALA